jgi:hypothetical protein
MRCPLLVLVCAPEWFEKKRDCLRRSLPVIVLALVDL